MFRQQAPYLLQLMVEQLAVKGVNGYPTEAGVVKIRRDINAYFHRLVEHIFISTSRNVTKFNYLVLQRLTFFYI